MSDDEHAIENETAYLRLPSGFYDTSGAILERHRSIISMFACRGREIGCIPLKTSPVMYRTSFDRGVHTTGHRTYQFTDRKGRELMLTADSTPAVMRWYLEQHVYPLPTRVFFEAPLSRYQHFSKGLRRHFTQLGYTLINEPDFTGSDVDEVTLTLLRVTTRTLEQDIGLHTEVHVADFALYRQCLRGMGLDDDTVRDVLHHLRAKSTSERAGWAVAALPDHPLRHNLLRIFEFAWSTSADKPLRIPPAAEALGVDRAMRFAHAAAEHSTVPVKVRQDDLHGSEIKGGISFRICTIDDGKAVADGGCYQLYGRAFDPRIRSVKSVATSLELLDRRMGPILSHNYVVDVLVLQLDSHPSFARTIETLLIRAGLTVIVRPIPAGKLSKALYMYRTSFKWAVVLGAIEEQSRIISVRHLESATKYALPLSEVASWLKERATRLLC